MERVFVVTHSHTLPGGIEDVKMIGVYRTLDAAKVALHAWGAVWFLQASQPHRSRYHRRRGRLLHR